MEQPTVERRREQILHPGLPLAVYREVAAHLRQVEGVKTGLIPQGASKGEASLTQQFDYNHSQVSGLWIQYVADLDADCQQRVEEILDYYQRLTAREQGTGNREQGMD